MLLRWTFLSLALAGCPEGERAGPAASASAVAAPPEVAPPEPSTPTPSTPASATRSIAAARRAELLARLAAPDGGLDALDPDWVQARLRELRPRLETCDTIARARDAALRGRLDVELTFAGEPGVGALVADLRVEATSTLADAGLIDCVRSAIYLLELPPPPRRGRSLARHHFDFEPLGGG